LAQEFQGTCEGKEEDTFYRLRPVGRERKSKDDKSTDKVARRGRDKKRVRLTHSSSSGKKKEKEKRSQHDYCFLVSERAGGEKPAEHAWERRARTPRRQAKTRRRIGSLGRKEKRKRQSTLYSFLGDETQNKKKKKRRKGGAQSLPRKPRGERKNGKKKKTIPAMVILDPTFKKRGGEKKEEHTLLNIEKKRNGGKKELRGNELKH